MSMNVGAAAHPDGPRAGWWRPLRGAAGALTLGAFFLMAGCGHVSPANASSSSSSKAGSSSAAKTSSTSASSLTITGSSNCAAGLIGTQTNVVAPRVGALAVDKPDSACWSQIAPTPFYQQMFATLPNKETPQQAGSFKTAWSSKYLFVNVQVNKWPLLDSTKLPIYEVDEVEIGVGPNDRNGTFTSSEGYGQYTFDGKNGIVKIYPDAQWSSKVIQGKGYIAEAIIPLKDIHVTAAKGSIVGLSVGADIPIQPVGSRVFVLWAGVFGFWGSDAQWGTITLG